MKVFCEYGPGVGVQEVPDEMIGPIKDFEGRVGFGIGGEIYLETQGEVDLFPGLPVFRWNPTRGSMA